MSDCNLAEVAVYSLEWLGLICAHTTGFLTPPLCASSYGSEGRRKRYHYLLH